MPQKDANPVLTIANLRGGRNGSDPPDTVPDVQCVSAFNVDWFRATLARKRGGSDTVNLSGGTSFTGKISAIFRHVPGADETAAELWGFDDAATPIVKRLTGGTSWADVSLDDAIASRAMDVNGVSFNGKLYLAYDTTVDRMHEYDPAVSKVRRMGLAQPAVPTTGAPSGGAATETRTYKISWTRQVSSVTVRRSELSTATGSVALVAQQVVVTKSTAPGEGETHWELWAAGTNGTYYLIATTVIATATATDNNATISTVTGTVAPTVGTNTVMPSVRYLSSDGNRLLGAGAWETGVPGSRVWFTPVLGDNNVGDDERYVNSVSRKTYIDLNENDGGAITAISLPLLGSIFVFKYRQVWKLVPTGDVDAPYLPYQISKVIGCISHKSLCMGEDQAGRPCLYFASAIGPYRIGADGLEYLGQDIEDIWLGTVNLAASNIVGHGLYYPDKQQYWLWVATGASNDPDTIYVLNTRMGVKTEGGGRGGWAVYTGDLAASRCSVLFSNTLGASMSRDIKPYAGRSTGTTLLKADTASTSDNGTAFRAYLLTKAYPLGGEGQTFTVHYPHLTGEVSSGVTITITISQDYGLATKASTASLTAAGTESRVKRKVEGAALAGCKVVQFEIGDASATANAWRLDKVVVPYIVDAAA